MWTLYVLSSVVYESVQHINKCVLKSTCLLLSWNNFSIMDWMHLTWGQKKNIFVHDPIHVTIKEKAWRHFIGSPTVKKKHRSLIGSSYY